MKEKASEKTKEQLLAENEDLRARLDEAEDALRAIQSGEVDALVVSGEAGEQIFTLQGADQSYRMLVENMSEGALTLTMDGEIIYANQRFSEILRMPLEKVIGSTIHTWIAPDNSLMFQSLLRRGVNEKQCEELIITAGDGTLVPIYFSVSELFRSGNNEFLCAVVTDLTERKRNEAIAVSEQVAKEELRIAGMARVVLLSALEDQKRVELALKKAQEQIDEAHSLAHIGVWEWDIAEDRTDWSRELYLITGVNPAKAAPAYKDLHDFYTPDSWQKLSEAIGRALDKGESYNLELCVVRPNGNIRWTNTFGRVKLDDRGKIVRLFGTVQDITERKKMEQELEKSRRLEAIGTLAGGMAHDFNNLLTAILGNIAITKMHMNSDNKDFDKLTNAENACMKAAELTKRIITFSKGGDPILKPVSISEIATEAICPMMSGSDITCECVIPEHLYPVYVDEGQIRQVFRNMAINAKEAMPHGGVIRIDAENITLGKGDIAELKEGKYVKISIKDSGKGIPEDILPKIFDPYFTTKEMGAERGLGLGLAVCYSIVKKHNGHIAVESKTGEGTTFHVYLAAVETEIKGRESLKDRG